MKVSGGGQLKIYSLFLSLINLRQCTNFYGSEYAKHPEIDENVAVIVCGRETKIQRHFSNHYEYIKHCLGNLKPGTAI